MYVIITYPYSRLKVWADGALEDFKMINIAILGFGVVGGGVAELLSRNKNEIFKLTEKEINIKYILDLKDFPDSPFGDRIVHDYDIILGDPTVDIIVETMGGSHPAYEYTAAALSQGKSVVTSNKEVVAAFGEQFMNLANANGVVYRFEAAVGGGIPVLSPIIDCLRHNRISEIRGILNGTTNYILTKMFTLGESFDNALKDAQAKGYAEANPASDVKGIDAARKTVILTALMTGKLTSPEKLSTEGIENITRDDVIIAEKLGYKIRLIGRCIKQQEKIYSMVAPFLVPNDNMLANVSGVYNAIEVIGEPIGNVMFYGQGAGGGATASAIVGDIVNVITHKRHYAIPEIKKAMEAFPSEIGGFVCRHMFVYKAKYKEKVLETFGKIALEENGKIAVITEPISEEKAGNICNSLLYNGIFHFSHIRIL